LTLLVRSTAPLHLTCKPFSLADRSGGMFLWYFPHGHLHWQHGWPSGAWTFLRPAALTDLVTSPAPTLLDPVYRSGSATCHDGIILNRRKFLKPAAPAEEDNQPHMSKKWMQPQYPPSSSGRLQRYFVLKFIPQQKSDKKSSKSPSAAS